MRNRLVIFTLFLFLILSHALNAQNSIQKVKDNLYFLASPELQGRYPGTKADSASVGFIQKYWSDLGLQLPYNNGLQEFKVTTSVDASANNSLSVNEKTAVYDKDYSLYSFSSNANLEGDLVFAGFGIVFESDSMKWNDYKNLDVKDKWVLLMKGDPEPQNNNSVLIPFSDARTKVMFAKDRGAKGVLFTGGTQNNKTDDLVPLLFERAVVSAGIPVLDVKRSWLDANILPANQPVDSLESFLMRKVSPTDLKLNLRIKAQTELIRNEVTTFNVIGILPGHNPILKDEYIVIGAHYDHLGMGGEGSGSRTPDTLAPHVGADDNASGVTSVLELAARFAKSDINHQRSIAFVLFGAEEMGLLGSRYFVKHMPFEPKSINAMINLDMVGRLNETKSVVIGGTGTSAETESILKELSVKTKLQLSFSPEGFGASDHASFYAENVPVLFFSTGAHADYHTPADTPDKINYEGMMEVIDFVEIVTNEFSNKPEKLTFTEAGPKERTTGRRGFKVTLGIMPDFTSISTDGLGVGGVTKGGPAERAGMKKGDKITGINGMSVGTIYDYMNRLKQLKPGQRVNVDVLRNDENLVLIVDL